MLGRSHLSLSIATIFSFIVPLLFIASLNSYLSFAIAFLISIAIGSLLPDSDCGGKSKLYYDFKIIYYIMTPINWAVVNLFKLSRVKHRLNLQHEVEHEHRGIMHSPVGVFISSLLLTLVLIVFVLVLQSFNVLFIFLVFMGLVFGQFLHLLEDSCTISGINWKFPFGTKEIKGTVYTFEGREAEKRDSRVLYYSFFLFALPILIAVGYLFNKISFSLFILYPIILILEIIMWFIILYVSRMPRELWLVDAEQFKKMKSFEKNFKFR